MARGGTTGNPPDSVSDGTEGSSYSRLQKHLERFLKRHPALLPARDPAGRGLVQLLVEVEVRGDSYLIFRSPVRARKHLSPTERKVASLAVFGYTNKEIAVDLGIKPSTISTHFKRIFRKLGVHTRTGILKEAFRAGILSSHGALKK